jgi:hypothetical protein
VDTVTDNSLDIEAEAGSVVKGKFDIKQAAAVNVNSGSVVKAELTLQNWHWIFQAEPM